MAHKISSKLLDKGWSKAELKHAQGVFEKAEENKDDFTKSLDQFVYWLLVLLGVVGALLFSGVVFVLSLILPSLVLWPTALFFGILYGFLFLVLSDLHWISEKQQLLTSIVFGFSAALTLFVLGVDLVTGFLFLAGLFIAETNKRQRR